MKNLFLFIFLFISVCVSSKEFSNDCWSSRALYSSNEWTAEPCTPAGGGDCSEGDFENYNTGNISNQSGSDQWTLWDANSGDGVVTTERAFGGTKSLKITASNPTTDVVYRLGNKTEADGNWDGNDVYRLSWKMYVPGSNGAYYNMQHSESLNHWAYEVYFNPNGTGEIQYGTSTSSRASFSYPKNQWFSATQIVRLRTDEVELWINGSFVHKWRFSIGTIGGTQSDLNQIGAINFYGLTDVNALFYVDDFLCYYGETCFGIFDCSAYPDVVCVNGTEYAGSSGGGGCSARCAGYTDEEWTVGACTSGPCYDCWDCFSYIADDNDPNVCRLFNNYCEEPRDVPTTGIEKMVGYDYEWTVTGGSVNYLNGTSSTSLNPIMRFPTYGTYTICMRVYYTFPSGYRDPNPVYECCLVVIVNPNSNCSGPPVAHFSYTFNSSDNSFTLNSGSSTGVTNRKWDFGDNYGNGGVVTFLQGTSNTSTSPRILIPNGYCREICLSVGNGCGFSTYCVTLCRSNSGCQGNTPVYTLNNAISPSINNYTVSFSGIPDPGGTVVSYDWDFGDGVGKSTSRNPSYTYPRAGNFLVCLVIKIGCKTICYCWTVKINPCPPAAKVYNCGYITHRYSGSGNDLRFLFTSTQNIAPGQSWLVNDQPISGSTSNTFNYPFPSPGQYEVCFPYLNASGCLEYCCYLVDIFNPFDCYTWDYYYLNNQGFQFRLNNDAAGATDISWTDDTNNFAPIGNGSVSNILPIPPGGCVEKTITVRYFLNGRWYICCRKIWLCNPFDCFDFDYNYIATSNGFRFQLNLSGATRISWTNDNDNTSLGIGATSQILPVPGNCGEYTITVRYLWNGRWYICCRRVWLCNPFDCLDFRYQYVQANNGLQFQLNQSGATNVSWTNDTDNFASLGNNVVSNILSIPSGNCSEKVITVRYFLNNRWYICCRRIWLCNPNNCGTDINYSVDNTGLVTLNTNTSYQDIQWYDGNTLIGSQNQINRQYAAGSTITICLYYRGANGIYYVCCRTFTVQPCNLPTPLFTANTNGTIVSFSNNTSNGSSYNWDFGNGQTSTAQSPPPVTYLPGNYRVCLTATNACGSNTYCIDITVEDNTTLPPWTKMPTSKNHTIVLGSGLVSLIDDQPLKQGDYVGVFFERNGQLVCSNFEAWLSSGIALAAYGNDATSPNKNGLSNDEVFKFKVWRGSEAREFDAVATFQVPAVVPFDATDKWKEDGLSNMIRLESNSSITQNIQLTTGWNIISAYVLPDNPNMLQVLAPIANKVVLIKDENGISTIPGINLNSLGNWDMKKGYKIRVTENTVLPITGKKVNPADYPITISNGWKIISYLCDNGNTPGEQFASILNSVVLMKDQNGKSFIPSSNIDQIRCMRPGYGYQIRGLNTATFNYQCNDTCIPALANFIRDRERDEEDFEPENTDVNATLVFVGQEASRFMEPGDVLEVQSSGGKVYGAHKYEGGAMAVTVWGDDPFTKDQVEGFYGGEQMYFRIKKESGESFYLKFSFEGLSANFSQDAIYWVRSASAQIESGNIDIILFPNPASNDFQIRFITQTALKDCTIEIFDTKGELKQFRELGEADLSNNLVKFDSHVLNTGIYFVKITTGGKISHHRILIRK